jgi:hypothetical protein
LNQKEKGNLGLLRNNTIQRQGSPYLRLLKGYKKRKNKENENKEEHVENGL